MKGHSDRANSGRSNSNMHNEGINMAREKAFKLTDSGAEYPNRFGGQEVILSYPTTREEVRERIEEGADPEKVTDGFVFGQGINLTIQKWFKDELNRIATSDSDEAKAEREGKTDAELIELARANVAERKFGVQRMRGEGGGSGKKAIAAAEAKVADSREAVKAAYGMVPKSVRKTMREDLINRGIFTEAEMDELDAA